jgi:hypothetical protein
MSYCVLAYIHVHVVECDWLKLILDCIKYILYAQSNGVSGTVSLAYII